MGMLIRSNTVKAVKTYFHEQLDEQYGKNEVNMFIRLCFGHYLNYTTSDLLLNDVVRLSESQLLFFVNVVKQLRKEVPLQYILGETEFCGHRFKVNEKVLIPRPETEELVELVSKEMGEQYPGGFGLNVVDIGTGSGCIAISLKKALPLAHITALDVSYEALKVARENAELNEVKLNFVCADISRDYSKDLGLHVLVSNPPYVTEDEKLQMRENVLKYEPHLALFAPEKDPLFFYRVIGEFGMKNLVPGGHLYFEINQFFGDSTLECLKSIGYQQLRLIKDLNGNNRILSCVKQNAN